MKLCYMEHTQHRVTCEYTCLLFKSRYFLLLTAFQPILQNYLPFTLKTIAFQFQRRWLYRVQFGLNLLLLAIKELRQTIGNLIASNDRELKPSLMLCCVSCVL